MSGTPNIRLAVLRPLIRSRRPIEATLWLLSGLLAAATACSDSPSSPLVLRIGEGAQAPTLTLSPTAITLAIGDTASLQAQAVGPSGSQAGPLQWSSSNPLVASVDARGKVKGLAQGSTTISVSVLGITERATVTVTPPEPGTVTDLAVVSSTESAVSLRWSQVGDGTGAAARYALRYARAPLDWRSAAHTEIPVAPTAVGAALGHTVTGLEPDVDYEFQLIAYRGTLGTDAVGGPLSNKVRTRTLVVPPGDRLLTKGGDLQSGPVGAALPIPLAVQVLAKGEPKSGSTVTWSVVGGDGVVRSTSSVTDTEGRAQTVWVLGNRPGQQTVRAALGGVGDVLFTATARPGPVASVTVTPQSVAGPVDLTHQLSATAKDAYGNVVPDATFVWSTTNPGIVTVDGGGKATGKTVGTAEVYATSGTTKGSTKVKVDPTQVPGVTDLQVVGTTETSVTLRWTRLQFAAGAPGGYALRYGSPTITWTSASATQVGVGQTSGTTLQYTLTALQPGTPYQFQLAGYTGTLGSDAVFGPLSNIVGTATRSPAPSVVNVEVTPARHTFKALGEGLQLATSVRDAGGAVVAGTKLTSYSTNTSVATVDTMGMITAHRIGMALIVVGASCCTGSDTTQVTVTQVPAFVEIAPSSLSLLVGATEQLGVVVRDANRNPIVDAPVSWTSQATAVASVTQGGLVRGAGVGTTIIEAVAGPARGSAPVAVTAGVPGEVTDLRVPASTQTSLTVEWTEVSDGAGKPARYILLYGSSSQPITSLTFPGSTAGAKTTKTLTGLTPATTYGLAVRAFRVVGSDTVMGPSSSVVEARTQGAAGAQALFSDGFESGGLTHSAGGFRWTDPVNMDIAAGVGRGGGRGARFRYGPDAENADSWAELNFVMPPLQEVWFEYWIRIPTNYEHRAQNPDNNKWWLLTDRKEGYNVRAVLESWRGSLDRARPMWGTNADKGGRTSSEWDMATPDGLIVPGDRGNWVQLRFQIKVAEPGQSNGVWKMWKNGSVMINQTALPNAPVDRTSKFFREGYLMGWSNSGYSQRTEIILDDFQLYGSNPGW